MTTRRKFIGGIAAVSAAVILPRVAETWRYNPVTPEVLLEIRQPRPRIGDRAEIYNKHSSFMNIKFLGRTYRVPPSQTLTITWRGSGTCTCNIA